MIVRWSQEWWDLSVKGAWVRGVEGTLYISASLGICSEGLTPFF